MLQFVGHASGKELQLLARGFELISSLENSSNIGIRHIEARSSHSALFCMEECRYFHNFMTRWWQVHLYLVYGESLNLQLVV